MNEFSEKKPFDLSSLSIGAQLFLNNVFDNLTKFQTDFEKIIEIIEQNRNNLSVHKFGESHEPVKVVLESYENFFEDYITYKKMLTLNEQMNSSVCLLKDSAH